MSAMEEESMDHLGSSVTINKHTMPMATSAYGNLGDKGQIKIELTNASGNREEQVSTHRKPIAL